MTNPPPRFRITLRDGDGKKVVELRADDWVYQPGSPFVSFITGETTVSAFAVVLVESIEKVTQ